MNIEEIGQKARSAAKRLALLSTKEKNGALEMMADSLEESAEAVIKENLKDTDTARQNGLSDAMIDRLVLNRDRIGGIADGIRQIAGLPDPVGHIYEETVRPNGLKVSRISIPIGVIGIIYEARPNVTADTAALCLKSGNAVVLRGGKEAFHSNNAIASLLSAALEKKGITPDAIQFIRTTDREAVLKMLKLNNYIDVIIPRGGPGLIKFVSENSTIPVIKHDAGVCHVYIDESAAFERARDIAVNSKVQRPGVCNAAETLLVHSAWSQNLPALLAAFAAEGVELRGCKKTRELYPAAKPAEEEDWRTEYLSLTLAVKVVDSMDEAIEHIERYGSHHTDAIVTESRENGDRFLREVDSSAVMVNASTRFNDGGQFGLGAEMGISTQKLHARGPMGLRELTTYKYMVVGQGQVRSQP
ncbi:MAG: glutamate-5-semialdehyde dehydrogenase [Nitrospinota bacterium]